MSRKKVNHIVTIKGRSFEVNDNKVVYTPYDRIAIRTEYNYNTIYDAYVRPSVTKVKVWEDWNRWFSHNFTYGTALWCVGSRNCMQFTIVGKIISDDGRDAWYLWITRDHNRAYRIVNR